MIHTGDCIEVMAGMKAESVDAVVTDPPYGLEFMGREWDRFSVAAAASQVLSPAQIAATTPAFKKRGKAITNDGSGHPFQAWCEAWGRGALRVTKPGGYLLAFGGTRTHHRLVCGLEDAGWIIRDELTWVYASGFPKGKANLKPAHEPIVLARKPGPLRPLGIDAGRIPTDGEVLSVPQSDPAMHEASSFHLSIDRDRLQQAQRESIERTNTLGRWPSNVLLSDPALFDEPNPEVVGSGATVSSPASYTRSPGSRHSKPQPMAWGEPHEYETVESYGDSGGYSRFFLIPKAARSDREPVLRPDGHEAGKRFSTHPTMKPVDLMRHLIRLVTPTGGTILDPFLGSGTTGIAAEMEGFAWIGIEKEAEYVAIAEARLNGTQRGLGLDVPAPTDVRPKPWHRNDRNAMTRGERPRYRGKSLFGQGSGTGLPDEEPAA